MNPNVEPYIGPRPFERSEQDRFFGRERAAQDLLSRVIAHPVVLFYAQSGAGKTSLLNARLVPLLEAEGFEVFPPARIRSAIDQNDMPAAINNIYVFNALSWWSTTQSRMASLARMSLSGYLGERSPAFDSDGYPRPQAIIFDQFEEMFTVYPDRWSDRMAFFTQVAAVLEANRRLRVLLVIREDYIAQLDPYAALLPEKLTARFRLERLRRSEALDAISLPIEGSGFSFAQDVPEKLVDDLLSDRVETLSGKTEEVVGEFVEPVQLQIVCQGLWRHASRNNRRLITEDDLRKFGNVDHALMQFYEISLQRAISQHKVDELQLREWFEKALITPTGTRSIIHRGRTHTGDMPNRVVDLFENVHLVRGEWRAGARWHELTHDRFIRPIRESNRSWLLFSASETPSAVEVLILPERSQFIVGAHEYELRLDEGRVRGISQDLAGALEDLGGLVERVGVDLRDHPHDFLEQLGALGKAACQYLLPKGADTYIARLGFRSRESGVGLTFKTPSALSILWEALYLDPGQTTRTRPERFLGFRYPLGRTYWTIEATERIRLQAGSFVAFHDYLDSSAREVDCLRQQLISTIEKRWGVEPSPSNVGNELRHIQFDANNRLSDASPDSEHRFRLLHFACHGQGRDPVEISHLESAVKRLISKKTAANDRPLVFLNACQGKVQASPHRGMPVSFLKQGAGGVIAAFCQIPSNFASAFAAEFYRRVLESLLEQRAATVSELLLETRLHFLRAYNNPLGLAYGLHATSTQKLQLAELDWSDPQRGLDGFVLQVGHLDDTGPENYLDFAIHIGLDGQIRSYSEVGQRRAAISLDIPTDNLVIRLIEKNETDETLLKQFGRRLYDIIFPAQIDKHFLVTEAVARKENRPVRIRLTIEPDALARLPWEFTYREESGYFLATSPATVLSHCLALPLPQSYARKRKGPLHILTIIANPKDQGQLDVDEWERMVRHAVARPLKDGLLTLKIIRQATFERIRDALLEHSPDIVQFIGHGGSDDGKGYLALLDSQSGGTWMVNDEQFTAIFAGVQDRLGLVCLAECESATSNSPENLLGIALRIVQRGVPAVVATRYPMLASTAEIFLESFYRSIAARKPVDWAVQSARNSIAIKLGTGNREFATPVLFMRANDGSIF